MVPPPPRFVPAPVFALVLAIRLCGCGAGELDQELVLGLDSDPLLALDETDVEPRRVVKLDNIVIQCVMRKPRVLFVLPTTALPPPDLPTGELGAFRLTKQISAVARAHREALTRLDGKLIVLRSAGALTRLLAPRRAALRQQRRDLVGQATTRLDALQQEEERAYRALDRRLRARLAGPLLPARRASALYGLARANHTLETFAYLRALERFERQLERFEQLQRPDVPAEAPKRSPASTLRALNALIRDFPRYRHLDAAFYLKAQTLSDADRPVDGVRALLALVCPKLGTATRAPLSRARYYGCAPLRPDSSYNAEAWFRVGEVHFDEGQLNQAAAAYTRALQQGPQGNPTYDKALYKLAWSRYRGDRFVEAAALFDRLLRLPTGSELRVEAIQYLAISLAEPDWDRDGRPDVETPLQRVERLHGGRWNERYVPQVYRGLGDVLFDSARYKQAAEVYHVLIGRWPRSKQVGAARVRLSRASAEAQR